MNDPLENGVPRLVVGLGASAGGLAALRAFFDGVPDAPPLAFVVVVHLDPERESSFAELLQTHTSMPVRQVTGRVSLEPGNVYVIPPAHMLTVEDGHLAVREFEESRQRRGAIDTLFRSMSDLGERAAAVVLSGTGTDGTLGVQAIKERGGLVLVQDPDDAEHAGMPRSVLQAGHADVALPARELGGELLRLAETLSKIQVPSADEKFDQTDEDALHRILVQLRTRTGHDFSRYKRATLLRRVARRMQVNRTTTLPAYLDAMRANALEPRLLLKDLLISVTHFFRDAEAWNELESAVVPHLLDGGEPPPGGVRVWVPGCATGEEAYTIAMLLMSRASRIGYGGDIQVFASDLDESALAVGRGGLYPEAIIADVPPPYLERYFTPEGHHFRIAQEVRERVLFASHSLFTHPPFSRLDLVSCRNLLIYLERELQEDALRIFHYGLRPGGYLFLGSAESVDGGLDLFEAVATKHRIYRRVGGALRTLPNIGTLAAPTPRINAVAERHGAGTAGGGAGDRHLRLLEEFAPPSLVVDKNYAIVHLSESAGRFLLRPGGTPANDVLREIRSELRVELHEALMEAFEHTRPTTRGPVKVGFDGGSTWVHLVVRPGPTPSDLRDHALIVFVEATEAVGVERPPPEVGDQEYPADDPRVRRMRDELQRLRERLQATIEEYESSKEEMKASNEELQSINEEYRSTAEELETSREELQSVNEELETVNQELTEKVEEVSRANDDLKNLMASTDYGTLFLDRDLCIQRYTPQLVDLFNIRPTDHGRPIRDLSYNVEYAELEQDSRKVLRDLAPLEREARGPDETWFLIRIRPYRTVHDVIAGVVITFVDITRRKTAEIDLQAATESLERRVRDRTAELVRARDLFHDLFHASPAPMIMTRLSDGGFVDANEAYRDFFGGTDETLLGDRDLRERHWLDPEQRRAMLDEFHANDRVRGVEVEVVTDSGERRTALAFVEKVQLDGAAHELSVFIDITARKQAEQQVRALASRLTVAEQEERQRVARVLHDDLQQRLYGVRYKLEAIRNAAKKEGNENSMVGSGLAAAEEWLDDAIAETRRLTVDLSPPVLEGEGLADSLGWLVAQMRDVHGLDVAVVSEKAHKIREPDMRIMAFQTVRELLFNVVKHAGVDHATVEITEHDGFWRIQVSDGGVGFDPPTVALSSGAEGFGLRYLRERVGLFGGRMELDTRPGDGTRVSIFLPFPGDFE